MEREICKECKHFNDLNVYAFSSLFVVQMQIFVYNANGQPGGCWGMFNRQITPCSGTVKTKYSDGILTKTEEISRTKVTLKLSEKPVINISIVPVKK